MPVVVARTVDELSKSKNFISDAKRLIGNLDNVDIYFNQILVITYIRPEMTKGLILRPTKNVEEDVYQGKVGLVIKKGPMAFVDDGEASFNGQDVNVGDYIVYRAGDGFDITINGVACRMLYDRNIKMRIPEPEMVF